MAIMQVNPTKLFPYRLFLVLSLVSINLVFTTLLTGCTHYYTSIDSKLLERVEEWNRRELYGKSIDILKQVKPDHPQYESLQTMLTETIQLAAQYETHLLSKTEKLIANEQWSDAHQLFQQAEISLPSSATVINAKNEFLSLRHERLKALGLQLLLAEATSLPDRAPILAEIARVNPDDKKATVRSESIKIKMMSDANRLQELGISAFDNQQYKKSKHYFSLAEKLNPTPQSGAYLQQIRAHYQHLNRKKQKKNAIKEKNYIKQLISEFEEHFQKEKYILAKETITSLEPYRNKNPGIAELAIKLQQAIDSMIKTSIEDGQRLYSQGQFEGAYQIWRASLILEPNNPDLLSHIDRVQRVLKSIQRLNQTGQTLEFPTEE